MAAVAELGIWAIALVCLGLAFIVTVLVVALFRWLIDILNLIPKVNIGTAFLNTIEQGITSALGVAFGWVNHTLGASIHQLARFTDWVWREIEANAAVLAVIAPILADAVVAVRAVESLLHNVTHTSVGTSTRLKTLEKEYRGIDRQLRTLEKEYRGIDEVAVRKRLGALETEIGTIQAQTIPAIRSRESDAESAIGNLYDWVKGKASILGVGTITMAVSAALTSLGFDWLRCKENPFNGNKAACGLWSVLGRVLGVAAFVTAAFDFREFVEVTEIVARGVGDGVAAFEAPFIGSLPPLPAPQV